MLQRIESRRLQIKEFPDLWYFIGLIELIGEKEKSKEWSIDKCQQERKKLIKEYKKKDYEKAREIMGNFLMKLQLRIPIQSFSPK